MTLGLRYQGRCATSASHPLYVPCHPVHFSPCLSLHLSPRCCGALRQTQPEAPSPASSWLLPVLAQSPLLQFHGHVSVLCTAPRKVAWGRCRVTCCSYHPKMGCGDITRLLSPTSVSSREVKVPTLYCSATAQTCLQPGHGYPL